MVKKLVVIAFLLLTGCATKQVIYDTPTSTPRAETLLS
jgi:uncharacterized lipoprotein YajG